MPISVGCKCGRKFRVKDEAAGKKVRCPDCQKILLVPDPEDFESEDVDDWEEELPPRRASPPRSKGKKSSSKAKSSNVGMTILKVVVGVSAFLVSGYFTYNLVRGKKDVQPAQEVAAAPVDPSKSAPASLAVPSLFQAVSSEYGVQAPDGLIISPVLVHEMELIMRQVATQSGSPFQDEAILQGVRIGITKMRATDAQLFCLTPDVDKQLAECGEQTKSDCLNEYNNLYGQLEAAKLEPPQMVSMFHESAQSGEASCGRLKALSQIIAAKLRVKAKSP